MKKILANRIYSDSTLNRMTKKELIEQIRILEHNWSSAEEKLSNQAKYLKPQRKFLNDVDLSKADKIAVVIFNENGTTICGYHNMELKDKALAKHEIEIDIIDNIINVNSDRYFNPTWR